MKPYQKENRFFACGEKIYIEKTENGETHAFCFASGEKLSNSDLTFAEIYGGGENLDLENTWVIMRSGFVKLLSGGGIGGNISNTNLELFGGMVGGNIYGAGFCDTVKTANIKVCGGAVKHSIFACGSSKSLQKVNLEFSGASCTYIFSGAECSETELETDAEIQISSGNILSLVCGSNGKMAGSAEFTVLGGRIERDISYKNFSGKLKLNLYENIFVSNGLDEVFPSLPENADITFLPEIKTEKLPEFKETNTDLFSLNDEKLTFIFFELRHPQIPKNATPFPHFIGSCVFIRLPSGESILLDAANDYNADEIITNLHRLNVKKIDYLFITHYHKDHTGAADKIIENFEIGKILLPDIITLPKEKDMPSHNAMISAIMRKKCDAEKISRGMSFEFGTSKNKTEILCLNPIKFSDAPMNDCSLALKFTYRNNSVILGGDIGDNIEKELCDIYGKNLKCDLLKLSHHGITDQSYYEYINFCSPQVVIIDSLRESGCFVKTTTYSLLNVNNIPKENIFITGKHGLIRAEFKGEGKPEISYQYEINE